jgi:hypothetical protein
VSQNVDLSTLPFDGVVISKTAVTDTTDCVYFVPTLGVTVVTGEPESVLFLATGNVLKTPTSLPSNIKGFRGYFQLKDASAARYFRIDMSNANNGETTGISEMVNGSLNGENAVYDLLGRRVKSSSFNSSIQRKGLYIQNGKKFIIK